MLKPIPSLLRHFCHPTAGRPGTWYSERSIDGRGSNESPRGCRSAPNENNSRKIERSGNALAGLTMSVRRLRGIPGFSIERAAAEAENDAEILRLENLDTDVLPPADAIAATQAALRDDEANSYLPFTSSLLPRETVAHRLRTQTDYDYGPDNVVITA